MKPGELGNFEPRDYKIHTGPGRVTAVENDHNIDLVKWYVEIRICVLILKTWISIYAIRAETSLYQSRVWVGIFTQVWLLNWD